MRKNNYLITVMFMGLFVSCISAPKNPIDRGIYNPDNVPEEYLATLYLHEFVNIRKMDREYVDWPVQKQEPQVVRIPSEGERGEAMDMGVQGEEM
jgi:hypothetical protein